MPKVIAIVGSPRKGGNTETLTAEALKAIAEEGIETELITLAGKNIQHCDGCLTCTKTGKCHIEDDLQPIFDKMIKADGIILASPVYVSAVSSQMTALIDRTAWAARGGLLQNKVGGPIVVGRRAGHNFTFAQLLLFFFNRGIIVPGASYWTVGFGREKGEVAKDEEAIRHVKSFAKKVAWLIKKLK